MSQVHSLTGVPSAIEEESLRAASRIDPFWDGLWGLGSQAAWVSSDLVARQSRAGLVRPPAWMLADSERALDKVMTATGWRSRLELLGAVGSWRTLTSQQLAAFCGDPRLVGVSPEIRTLFSAGLLDVGLFQNGLATTGLASEATLVRPSKTPVMEHEVLPQLTAAERAVVTSSGYWRPGGQFDRHNLLSAELALRVSEFVPQITCVLGETLSDSDMYLGAGLGRAPLIGPDRTTADATLVREDGLRIAVEITANVSESFEPKVDRWARLMSRVPMASSGLVILFVAAPHPDRSSVRPEEYERRMRKVIAKVARRYPGLPGDQPADRMFVASWEDYFPLSGTVSDRFLSLTARRLTSPSRWSSLSVVDDFDTPFAPHDPDAFTELITAAAATATSPSHLRRKVTPVEVARATLLDVTGTTTIPVPRPADPRHVAGYEPGVFRASGLTARQLPRLSSAPSERPDTSRGPGRASR